MRPGANLEQCLAAAGAWELVEDVDCSRRVNLIVKISTWKARGTSMTLLTERNLTEEPLQSPHADSIRGHDIAALATGCGTSTEGSAGKVDITLVAHAGARSGLC